MSESNYNDNDDNNQEHNLNVKGNQRQFKIKRFISEKIDAKKIHQLLMIMLFQNEELNVAKEIELQDPSY